MNKELLGFALAFIFSAMLAAPVMADPTKGKKVAVTITWTNPAGTPVGIDETGIVVHRHGVGTWDVELEIDAGATYTGAAVDTVREVLAVPQRDGVSLVWREYFETWFESAGGGFAGNMMVLMDGTTGPSPRAKAHGLLHGYGMFEGQTINGGHHWVRPGPLV